MHRRVAPPRRLRRRLTIAFVLVAGVLAGALAAGSYLLVRETRLRDSLDRAVAEARLGLVQARDLPSGADPAQQQQFVDSYEPRFHAVLLVGGRRYASNPSVNPPIPMALRGLVTAGQLAFERVPVGGAPYLVVGGRAPDSRVELYFFFPETALHRDLSQLAGVLVLGWLAVVVAATLVGRLVAGGTLAPVAEASRAARSMAEGLLDTRLPVGATDEFGAWAASFNEMAEALEAKIAALSEAQARERRFTSDVAHELRTPLTALVSEASLLREHLDAMPPQARRPAELLVADVARLRRLLEDLMEISRLDAGQENFQAERLDLGSLVSATVLSGGWGSAAELDAGSVVVTSDRRRLERIVSNLVGNAVEHGGHGVAVRVGQDGTGAFVEISDRGPGIAPEHLRHVFERFYQADPSRAGPGSGLGLAIALENARLLGGDIEAWSEVGIGTRFTLRLPVAKPLHAGEGDVSSGGHDEAGGTRDRGEDP